MKLFLVLVSVVSTTIGQVLPDFDYEQRIQSSNNQFRNDPNGLLYRNRLNLRRDFSPVKSNGQKVSNVQKSFYPSTHDPNGRERQRNDLVLTISENGAQSRPPSKTEPVNKHENDQSQGVTQDLETQNLETQYDLRSQPLYKPVCFLTPVRNFLRTPHKTTIDHRIKPVVNRGDVNVNEEQKAPVSRQEVSKPEVVEPGKKEEKGVIDPNEKIALDPRLKVNQQVQNQNPTDSTGRSDRTQRVLRDQTPSRGRNLEEFHNRPTALFLTTNPTQNDARQKSQVFPARRNPDIVHNHSNNPFLTNQRRKRLIK